MSESVSQSPEFQSPVERRNPEIRRYTEFEPERYASHTTILELRKLLGKRPTIYHAMHLARAERVLNLQPSLDPYDIPLPQKDENNFHKYQYDFSQYRIFLALQGIRNIPKYEEPVEAERYAYIMAENAYAEYLSGNISTAHNLFRDAYKLAQTQRSESPYTLIKLAEIAHWINYKDEQSAADIARWLIGSARALAASREWETRKNYDCYVHLAQTQIESNSPFYYHPAYESLREYNSLAQDAMLLLASATRGDVNEWDKPKLEEEFTYYGIHKPEDVQVVDAKAMNALATVRYSYNVPAEDREEKYREELLGKAIEKVLELPRDFQINTLPELAYALYKYEEYARLQTLPLPASAAELDTADLPITSDEPASTLHDVAIPKPLWEPSPEEIELAELQWQQMLREHNTRKTNNTDNQQLNRSQ